MSQPPWPLVPTSSDSLLLPGRTPRKPVERVETELPKSRGRRKPKKNEDRVPIIAFCHLSWDWVWQRPQQFLSRLAERRRVLFVETYCADVPETKIEIRPAPGHPNVTLLQTHLPARHWHDGEFIDAERRRGLLSALAGELRGHFDRPLLWFNDPMAVVAFAGHLGERGIVYDCMDELTQFRGAPAELAIRERQLVLDADVIFCGGQKMRQKRLPLNSNTHFFGTGVDVRHFGAARSDELDIDPEIAAWGNGPVLGYFGVVDERIDYELLAKLADARDDWHIAIVGPAAKVNPADFPQRHNLHWLGARPYAQLPALTKGFAVALMPFALNSATEYINPTKALEYMAAGRPIVSTAIDEVRLNFGSVVRLAASPDEFVAHCMQEIARPSRQRIARGIKLAAENSWEAIVAQLDAHLESVVAVTAGSSAGTINPALAPTPLSNLAYV